MAETLAKYGLYPWLRKGLVNHIQADGEGAGTRAFVKATIEINNNQGNSPGREFPILGPGDIIGFDQRLVIRTEPQPNHTTFAPHYLAFIEFYEEDLPWRYTPLRNPTPEDSLRPWIFLIVLKDDEFKELEQKTPFPLIEIAKTNTTIDALRKDQAKYWAHVQRTDQDANQHPDRVISRIICPRKLDPNTPYTGFLLPAFDTGIAAGGGTPGTIYPVYYQWRFHTSNSVDFEYLVNLLEPRTMPYEIGRRFVDFTKPGFIDTELNINSLTDLMLEGPLIASKDAAPSPDQGTPIIPDSTQKDAFVEELEQLAKMTSIGVNHQQDPVVTIPFYGAKHVVNDTSDAELGTNYEQSNVKWLYDLNWKEPGNRASSGIGTKIIRRHQDDYMARAWEQLESVVAANKSLNLAEVMIRLTERWQEQYLKPIEGTLAYGQLMAPMLRQQNVYRNFFYSKNCLSPSVLSAAFRRQSGVGAILGRNIAKFSNQSKEDSLQSVLAGQTIHKFEHTFNTITSQSFILDTRNLNDYVSNDKPENEYIKAVINRNKPGPCTDTPPAWAPMKSREHFHDLLNKMYDGLKDYMAQDAIRLKPAMAYPHFDDPMFVKLRELGTDYLIANLDKVPNNTISLLESNQVFIESFMVGLNYELGREMRWREYPTDERGSYFRQFWDTAGLVDYDKAKRNLTGESEKYKDITEVHTWEGISGKNNLGNHRPPPPDIEKKKGAKESGTGNNMVLIIRGDLIRAFPTVTVYAVKAEEVARNVQGVEIEWPDPHSGNKENKINRRLRMKENEIRYPIFKAEVQPDVKFLGFSLTADQVKGTGKGSDLGYFFVLKEVPGELRLGLDIAPEQTTEKDKDYRWQWEDLSWPEMNLNESFINVDNNPFADKKMKDGEEAWGSNSAHMAAIFYQKPVMAVIHGSEMLPGENTF